MPRQSPRFILTITGPISVRLTLLDPRLTRSAIAPEVRNYCVPTAGGAICEVTDDRTGTTGIEVGRGLSHSGWLLGCSPSLLAATIRREVRTRIRWGGAEWRDA